MRRVLAIHRLSDGVETFHQGPTAGAQAAPEINLVEHAGNVDGEPA